MQITDAGSYIMTTDDQGQAVLVTLEEYKQRLAAKLVEDIPALDAFRSTWIDPSLRREMMGRLPDSGRAPLIVRDLADMEDFDLYDVLAEVAYGQAPKTRVDRAGAFEYKNRGWLTAMPHAAADALRAIASQFALGGTDNLENLQIFSTPSVAGAGGLAAPAGVRPTRPGRRRDQAAHVRCVSDKEVYCHASWKETCETL